MVVATSMPVVVTMIHKVAEETKTLPSALVVVVVVLAAAAGASVDGAEAAEGAKAV